jgi:hypothetical protein
MIGVRRVRVRVRVTRRKTQGERKEKMRDG